jgi:hypothetical protein
VSVNSKKKKKKRKNRRQRIESGEYGGAKNGRVVEQGPCYTVKQAHVQWRGILGQPVQGSLTRWWGQYGVVPRCGSSIPRYLGTRQGRFMYLGT